MSSRSYLPMLLLLLGVLVQLSQGYDDDDDSATPTYFYCTQPYVNAIASIDDRLHFFRNWRRQFVIVEDGAVQETHKTNTLNIGFDKLDAAFTWTDGTTYFFRGEHYTTLSSDGTVSALDLLTNGFAGLTFTRAVNAALIYQGKAYLLKGKNAFELDMAASPITAVSKTKINVLWPGVPNGVAAAFTSDDGVSYFFKRTNRIDEYWAFDPADGQVLPEYPKSTATDWYGC